MLSVVSSTAHPACPAPFNLAAHVLAGGGRDGAATALQVQGLDRAERWTSRRLIAARRGVGMPLPGFGFGPGDWIVPRPGTDAVFPVAFPGTVPAGIVPVPPQARLTRPEIDRIGANLSPALVLAPGDRAHPTTASCPVLPVCAPHRIACREPGPWTMGGPGRLVLLSDMPGRNGTDRAVMHAHRSIRARQLARPGGTAPHWQDRLFQAGPGNRTCRLGSACVTAPAATRPPRCEQPGIYVRVPALPRDTNRKLPRHGLCRRWEGNHGQA
jgi:hypothetical protein